MFLRHLIGIRSFSRTHGRIPMGVLEGSSDTNKPLVSTSSPTKLIRVKYSFQKRIHHIVTLDPNKFAEKKQQRLHIGNIQSFLPYVSLHNKSSPVVATSFYYDLTRKTDTQMRPSYPPDTGAFLYYFTSPEKPRIAGEIRLRVTSSDDPASFESGSDLLRTDGQLWSRPLGAIAKYCSPLYEKLREEKFVPDDLDTVLLTLPPVYHRYIQHNPLYTLNDTFIVDFSGSGRRFSVFTEQGVAKLHFLLQFTDSRDWCSVTPYIGT